MGRLLFLLVIFIVIYWLLKSYRSQLGKDQATADRTRPTEDMVRCAHCGVHLPKHESTMAGGKYFCSEAHRHMHNERSDQS